MSRAFDCPKCESPEIMVRYNVAFDRLDCTCDRCRHKWSEDPKDRRTAPQREPNP